MNFQELLQSVLPMLPYLVLSILAAVLGIRFFVSAQRMRRRREYLARQRWVMLRINVPRNNEKTPLAAEQMFASLYGIAKKGKMLREAGNVQDHISFEIVSAGKYVSFYVMTPANLRDFVEGQIYAQYPTVEIHEVPDYSTSLSPQSVVIGTNLTLLRDDVYPIKTFPNFEVDPLAAITAVLSKMDLPEDQIWIQILIRPYRLEWRKRGLNYVRAVRSGRTKGSLARALLGGIARFFVDLVSAAISGPVGKEKKEERKIETSLSAAIEQELKAVEAKSAKLPYEVKINIVVAAKDSLTARERLKAVVGTFHQFTLLNINGFVEGPLITDRNKILQNYRNRTFEDKKSYVLNTEEIASIFHLPNASVETPNIVWAGTKKGEPPANLPTLANSSPKEITIFAKTNFRHIEQEFGIRDDDRRRHMYIIGKTGMGKSTMMENMAISDIMNGKGIGYVDPHGEGIERILRVIPDHRINDVVLFDPADIDYPIAFNLLENISEDFRPVVASGLIGIFKKIWADSWGPRLEYILRNTILALLENKDQTLLGITRMLTDKEFRKRILANVKDPVVLAFWQNEFAQYNDKFRNEAVAPVLNKVGQFLSSSTIRNIVGQPRSSIDVREIMDSGKIFLMKISKGAIGEDNAALLGAMLITKIQLAAMSRVDIPEAERRDFYLYVDEFQNFATESFANILSEARKYRLSLTMANQYIAQMPDTVRDAVFGNVGSMVVFRVGATDAHYIEREFTPVFLENDFVNLNKFNIYLKLAIDGITSPAFSAVTLPPPALPFQDVERIYKVSRERYSTPREEVERKIAEWAAPFPEVEKEKVPSEPKIPRKEIITPQTFKKQSKEMFPKKKPEVRVEKSELSLSNLQKIQPRPFHKGEEKPKEFPKTLKPGEGIRLDIGDSKE
jgi:hypothetical protein